MLAGSSFQSSFKNIQLQFELMKYVLDHQRYGRYYGNVPSLLALPPIPVMGSAFMASFTLINAME